MRRRETKKLLQEEIARLRTKTYSELCKYIGPDGVETKDVESESGVKYHLEIMAFWDDKRKPFSNLRVSVCIDDGGWRSFFPISDSFIISPDGLFTDSI